MSGKVYRADVWLKLMKENKNKESKKQQTKTRQSNKKSNSNKGDK